jgi:hypothetical protein
MKGDEHKSNVMRLIQDHEDKGGITKNEAATILINQYGGSRSTYWNVFEQLIKEGQIQLKTIKKQQQRLFPTENKKKVEEFKEKIKKINDLLKLLKEYPEIGDCFSWHVTDKIPNSSGYYLREIDLWKRVVGYTRDFESKYRSPEAYCIQARYDILKNLPIFLMEYIDDTANEYPNLVKEEVRKMIYPIMLECIKMAQGDYSRSPYYSNKFFEQHTINTKISLICGLPLEDIKAEFLRILGRYYFAISKKFVKADFDVCREQKIISEFIKTFFHKSKIPDDKLSDGITTNLIIEYWLDEQKPRKKFFKEGMLERLDEVHQILGGKFARKFDRYGNNDPFLVANFSNKWIFTLELFSRLEKRIIQTYLDETEKYEMESKTIDHDDPLEEMDYSTWKDFRGKLSRSTRGRSKIILNNSYSEVKSHVGRWTRILIEE